MAKNLNSTFKSEENMIDSWKMISKCKNIYKGRNEWKICNVTQGYGAQYVNVEFDNWNSRSKKKNPCSKWRSSFLGGRDDERLIWEVKRRERWVWYPHLWELSRKHSAPMLFLDDKLFTRWSARSQAAQSTCTVAFFFEFLRTLPDRPAIRQIYEFLKHSRSSDERKSYKKCDNGTFVTRKKKFISNDRARSFVFFKKAFVPATLNGWQK